MVNWWRRQFLSLVANVKIYPPKTILITLHIEPLRYHKPVYTACDVCVQHIFTVNLQMPVVFTSAGIRSVAGASAPLLPINTASPVSQQWPDHPNMTFQISFCCCVFLTTANTVAYEHADIRVHCRVRRSDGVNVIRAVVANRHLLH